MRTVAGDRTAAPLRKRPIDGMMASNVLIILMEERYGVSASPHFGVVVAANSAWLLMPVAMILRMRRAPVFPGQPAPA